MRETKQKTPFLRSVPLLVALVIGGIGFLAFLGIKALATPSAEELAAKPAETGAIPVMTQAAPAETTRNTEPNGADVNGRQSNGDDVPVETDAPETTTEAPETEVVSQLTTVDKTYFADALFIGDSRTDGLKLYNPIGDAKYYSGTSMTIFKIMDDTQDAYGYYGIRGLLQSMQFGKIYIMFGINECGYDTDVFAAKYREVIEEIRGYQPNALIYIQSILYVTQEHEAQNSVFASTGIDEKNDRLKELANDVDIFYLEVNDALNDGTNHLPADYTGDGVHLKASYYHLWAEYLMEHAVVNEAHPWPTAAEEAADSGAASEQPAG